MSSLDIGGFGEKKEELLRDPIVFEATQIARGRLNRIYGALDNLRDFEKHQETKKMPGAIGLDQKNAMVRRDSNRLWAQIIGNINQIPAGDLGADQHSVDILFWQINQALHDLRRIAQPNAEMRGILQGLLSGTIERGSVSVPVAKRVRNRVAKMVKPPKKAPEAKPGSVAEIIELPPESFVPPKPAPVSRVVGKEAVEENTELRGHDSEVANLIESARPNRLVQALKAKTKQMIEQDGIPAETVFAFIHSFSQGEEGSRVEVNLGKVLCSVYELGTVASRRLIHDYVTAKYDEKKMRGPIKNQLANLKIKGEGGKKTDFFPFIFLQDEGHATSAEAQAHARAHRKPLVAQRA